MVGEIRDHQTAALAINTALTGHLVLSTIHANDAATVLPRLIDLNIEPYLIASTVSLIISQRLVRKLCSQCKEKSRMSASEWESVRQSLPSRAQARAQPPASYQARGCEHCNHTGYHGRTCMNEVLVVDQLVRDAIYEKATGGRIASEALKQGMTPILEDGLRKVEQGVTTIEEVLRAFHE